LIKGDQLLSLNEFSSLVKKLENYNFKKEKNNENSSLRSTTQIITVLKPFSLEPPQIKYKNMLNSMPPTSSMITKAESQYASKFKSTFPNDNQLNSVYKKLNNIYIYGHKFKVFEVVDSMPKLKNKFYFNCSSNKRIDFNNFVIYFNCIIHLIYFTF
jgi:hypothetical protein